MHQVYVVDALSGSWSLCRFI